MVSSRGSKYNLFFFFHNKASNRRKKNTIDRIHNDSGCWVEDDVEIEDIMVVDT